MTTVTDSDLKELKEFLNSRFDKLEAQIQKIEISVAKIETKVEALEIRINDNNKRIDSVDARLNTFMLGFLSIVGILVTGILGIVGKVVFFPNA